MSTTRILQHVVPDSFARDVADVASDAYRVTLTRRTAQDISACVINGDGKSYAVTLTDGRAVCACCGARFRGQTCKQATALALYALRAPHLAVNAESQHDLPPSDVRFSNVRRSPR